MSRCDLKIKKMLLLFGKEILKFLYFILYAYLVIGSAVYILLKISKEYNLFIGFLAGFIASIGLTICYKLVFDIINALRLWCRDKLENYRTSKSNNGYKFKKTKVTILKTFARVTFIIYFISFSLLVIKIITYIFSTVKNNYNLTLGLFSSVTCCFCLIILYLVIEVEIIDKIKIWYWKKLDN